MKIVGIGVAGAEASRYLIRTLDCFEKLCDSVIICSNAAHDPTEAILKQRQVDWYRDTREWGIYQPQIKEALVARTAALEPDWILSLDMDEEFGSKMSREGLEALTMTEEVAWYFWFAQKWNDEEHYRHDMGFWDVRFFKNMPEMGVKFENKPVHCGMAPKWAYVYGFYAPYIIIHRGLLDREERRQKILRYEKYDPDAKWCGREYYDALASEYAGDEFNEDMVQGKVEADAASWTKRVTPKIEPIKTMKMHRHLRLADNTPIDIEDKYCYDNIQTGGTNMLFRCLGEIPVFEESAEAPVIDPLKCAICGFESKNKLGASSHARKHQPR